ncbi:aminotransferase-like domain-containing protein [Kushneria aurantia]|uniref:PLP-dependent aminotransferase family protein n=1 Tax=Kushneria aurantia TaxID=504092 RepID=A0ABV6G0H6_9GAMM|nr:PLP-dependent aminotransferase family protein [Kushneria aurantia]
MTIWTPRLADKGPRYRALAEAIEAAIADGELAAGTRLPPQRRLADALSVTVGTVTRAYALVEQKGLVEARVGSGTYVREAASEASPFVPSAGSSLEEDTIDLALSLPPPSPRRQAALASALGAIAGDGAALDRAVNYPLGGAPAPHRNIYARWLARLGLPVEADELLIDQGGMNGISLALGALLSPGERLAAEALSYPGLISAARERDLRTVALPFDDDGIDVETLAARFDRQPFRALYLMPDHHNPTTARLCESRREALVALARQRDFWLIEDGVMLLPQEERGTPLYRLAPERTLFLFSVAKILGGGLRAGVMRAPPALHERLAAVQRHQVWAPPALTALAVDHWLASGAADELLDWQFEELAARESIVREQLGDFDIRLRRGGFYVWLTLPGEMRAAPLIEHLARRGVRVTPGEAFCVGSTAAPQAIRLCFSAAGSREQLAHALEIVREALSRPAPALWQTL